MKLLATAALAGAASVYAIDCIDTVNDPTGLNYDGKVMRTTTGRKCASWRYGLRRSQGSIDQKDVRGGIKHRFCRNPDNDDNGPWCFVYARGGASNWAYCNIDECENVNPLTTPRPTERPVEDFEPETKPPTNNNNSSNAPTCGIRGKPGRNRRETSSFIVNGEQAFKGELPWQVHLRKSWGGGFCGGSILNDRFILTASHCILDSWGNLYEQPSGIKIAVGWFDKFGTDRHISDEDRARGSDFIGVKRFITHENYDSQRLENDIALIELERPIQWGELVRPACLPTQATQDNIMKQNTGGWGTCTVSGWGDTRGNPSYSENLLAKADMPLISNLQCGRMLFGSNYPIADHSLCAMHQGGGQDSCQGDSGGPLVCQDASSSANQDVQLGVVSWGYDCGKNSPGVYANVLHFVDWIQRHTDDLQFV